MKKGGTLKSVILAYRRRHNEKSNPRAPHNDLLWRLCRLGDYILPCHRKRNYSSAPAIQRLFHDRHSSLRGRNDTHFLGPNEKALVRGIFFSGDYFLFLPFGRWKIRNMNRNVLEQERHPHSVPKPWLESPALGATFFPPQQGHEISFASKNTAATIAPTARNSKINDCIFLVLRIKEL